jgi:hypothetical protein
MSNKSLFDLHKSLTGENLKIEIKKKAVKRRTIKEVEEEKDDIIRELKKEIILLKNLLGFYIHDDWD